MPNVKETIQSKVATIEVRIPTADGAGVAETIPVKVRLEWDAEMNEWLLTEEAHQVIDDTKARYMGLISPGELKDLRGRFGLSQRQICSLLQVGEKSYTRWESGRARPSRSMNVLLCALRDGWLPISYLRSLQKPVVQWWNTPYQEPVIVTPFPHLEPVPIEEREKRVA